MDFKAVTIHLGSVRLVGKKNNESVKINSSLFDTLLDLSLVKFENTQIHIFIIFFIRLSSQFCEEKYTSGSHHFRTHFSVTFSSIKRMKIYISFLFIVVVTFSASLFYETNTALIRNTHSFIS